ncbi:MAG: dTMP kinase [Candidatus Flexifilum sp.]
MKPLFIVLEGLDGAGKTTLGRTLTAHLKARFGPEAVLFTYEPHDDSAAGDYIRAVLTKQFAIAPRTLALAYALNRADHTERVIAPHLAAGGIVICDRYLLSSLAYNSGPGLPLEKVLDWNAAARQPDVTLFLDASAEICYQRLGARGGDRELFEAKLDDRRARYLEAIAFLRERGQTIAAIDASGTPDEVLARALAAIDPLLEC